MELRTSKRWHQYKKVRFQRINLIVCESERLSQVLQGLSNRKERCGILMPPLSLESLPDFLTKQSES